VKGADTMPVYKHKADREVEKFVYDWGAATLRHLSELVHPYPEQKLKRLIKGLRVEERDGVYYVPFRRLKPDVERRRLAFLDFMVDFLQDRVTLYYPADFPFVSLVKTTKGKLAYVSVIFPGEEELVSELINMNPPESVICVLQDKQQKDKIKLKSKIVKFYLKNGEEVV